MKVTNYSIWIVILLWTKVQLYFCQNPTENIQFLDISVPATSQQLRYQVAILANDRFLCSGTLISSKTILTAAYCLYNHLIEPVEVLPPENFTIIAGSSSYTNLSSHALELKISKYIIHDYYLLIHCQNDIALMFLSEKIPENHPVVRPIQVAREIPQITCELNGWGSLCSGTPISSNLRTLNVTIIHEDICLTKTLSVTEGLICAGDWEHGKEESCQGDSGSPLSCNENLIGILTWPIGCGVTKYPGVYTDVIYYREWIIQNGGFEGILEQKSTANEKCGQLSLIFLSLFINFIILFNYCD